MPRKTKNDPNQYSMDEYFIKKADVRLKLSESPGLYSYNPITTPDKAVNVMAGELASYASEVLCVVNLDSQNHAINFNICSMGTISSTEASMREIFKSAILSNARSIIILHNHPSGDPTPSKDDIKTTQRAIAAGKLLGVPVLDHVIIGAINRSSYSLYEQMTELWDENIKSNGRVATGFRENGVSYAASKDKIFFKIFRLRDNYENVYTRFTPLAQWKELGRVPEISQYEEVIRGEITRGKDVKERAKDIDLCEALYTRYNTEIPEGYLGYSMAVSDVVMLEDAAGKRAFFCDSIGFRLIRDFEYPIQNENPLKNAEELEEQNYNMIDGIANNGYGERKEKRSIAAIIEEKKQLVAFEKKKKEIARETYPSDDRKERT